MKSDIEVLESARLRTIRDFSPLERLADAGYAQNNARIIPGYFEVSASHPDFYTLLFSESGIFSFPHDMSSYKGMATLFLEDVGGVKVAYMCKLLSIKKLNGVGLQLIDRAAQLGLGHGHDILAVRTSDEQRAKGYYGTVVAGELSTHLGYVMRNGVFRNQENSTLYHTFLFGPAEKLYSRKFTVQKQESVHRSLADKPYTLITARYSGVPVAGEKSPMAA